MFFWLWPQSFLPKPKVAFYWRPLRSPSELRQVGGFTESPILFLKSCKQPLNTEPLLTIIHQISIEISTCMFASFSRDWPIEKAGTGWKGKSVKNGHTCGSLTLPSFLPETLFLLILGYFHLQEAWFLPKILMHKFHFLYWLTNILLDSLFASSGLQISFKSQEVSFHWKPLRSPTESQEVSSFTESPVLFPKSGK